MPIRLSCADFSFSRLNFAQCCQLIAWLGIEYVDIGIYAEPGIAHFTVKDVLGDTRMVADLVLAGTQAAGIRVGQIFVNPHHPKFANLAVNHPDLTVRSESAKIFRHAIDLALQVGASSIGGLPGVTFNQLGPVRSFELAVQELTHRAEMAGERGLRFVVEPHIGSLLENPAIVHEFCTVAPAVRLLLDYSHFIFQGYPQDVVDQLLPYAGHVHLRQAARGALQIVSRAEEIDFGRMYEGLEQVGFDGFICTEYIAIPWFDCDRVDVITETSTVVEQFAEWGRSKEHRATDVLGID